MKTSRLVTLSTGDAAARLAVTPDTILKWIKKGKIPAQKTPGGHHRIDVSVIDRLLSTECPLNLEPGSDWQPVRCWEYFSLDGAIRAECRQCAAYRVRAALCFELSRLEPSIAVQKAFCATTCEDCPYYRNVRGLPARVLAITGDAALARSIESMKLDGAILCVANDVYTASAEIGEFRPSVVLLDSSLPSDIYLTLKESIGKDRRVPWVRLVSIGGEPAQGGSPDLVVSRASLKEQLPMFLRGKHVETIGPESAGEPSPG